MAKQTLGKTVLNQGDADDAILEVKSSDVAHGMTDRAETDTYGSVTKQSATAGGLQVAGYTEDIQAVRIAAEYTNGETNKTTSAFAAFVVNAAKKSGTTVGAMGANENLAAFANAGTVRFILDGDGDSHQDVGTAWTNFDIFDDVEVLDCLAAHVTRQDDPLRGEFNRWLTQPETRRVLEAHGLVTFNDGPDGDGSIFVNMSRLTMLCVGALRQYGKWRSAAEQRMAMLEAQMMRLLPAGA